MYIQYHICVPIENDNMKNLMVISEFNSLGLAVKLACRYLKTCLD